MLGSVFPDAPPAKHAPDEEDTPGTFFAEFLPAGLLDTHSPATAQTAGSSASSPKQPGTSAFAQAQPGSWQRQQAGSRSTRSRLTALGADRLRAGGAGAASIAQQPPPPPAPAAGASPTPLQQRQRHDQQQQQQQQQHQQQQQQQQHNAASSPAVVGAAGSFPRAHAAAPSTPAFFDAHSRAGSSAASSSSGEFVSGGDSDGDLFDFGLPTPGEVATRLGRALFGGDADDANDASSSGLDRWLPFGGPDGLRRRVSRGGGPGGLLPGWRLSSGGSGGVASRWAARHQPLRLKLAEQVVLGLGGFVAPPGSADMLPKEVLSAVQLIDAEILSAPDPLPNATIRFFLRAAQGMGTGWVKDHAGRVFLGVGAFVGASCGAFHLAKAGAKWLAWRTPRVGQRALGPAVTVVADVLLPSSIFGPLLAAYVVVRVAAKQQHEKQRAAAAAGDGQQPQQPPPPQQQLVVQRSRTLSKELAFEVCVPERAAVARAPPSRRLGRAASVHVRRRLSPRPGGKRRGALVALQEAEQEQQECSVLRHAAARPAARGFAD